MNKADIARENRNEGKAFENVFETQCRYNGILPIKNQLTAKFINGGRVVLEKSNLDYTLIRKSVVAFADCKSFAEDSFTYSEIAVRPQQLERAVLYNEHGVAAGFVVWHRKSHRVVYYHGGYIFHKGPGNSFLPTEGVLLGNLQKFNTQLIFDSLLVRK